MLRRKKDRTEQKITRKTYGRGTAGVKHKGEESIREAVEHEPARARKSHNRA